MGRSGVVRVNNQNQKWLVLALLLLAVVALLAACEPEKGVSGGTWESRPVEEWHYWDGLCLYDNNAGEEKKLVFTKEYDYVKPKCPDLEDQGWKLKRLESGFHLSE